jgi:hypothetical protein
MANQKYKTYELEISPKLLEHLFEYIKTHSTEDFSFIIENLKYLSSCDDTLTMDEYQLAITKPLVA